MVAPVSLVGLAPGDLGRELSGAADNVAAATIVPVLDRARRRVFRLPAPGTLAT